MVPSRILFKDSTVYAIIIPSLIALVILIAALSSFYYIIAPSSSYAQTLSATTFPRPIFYQLRNEPSYAITIPFSSSGNSTFDPPDVSIPLGMTIIWFNDDNSYHTVTTISNKTYSPPVKFDSSFIPTNGGSYVHTFDKAGAYDYYDKQHPSSLHGRIYVFAAIKPGKNMNMMIGGKMPFNPSEARRVVLSFVPKTISIPPTTALTYQVTISNLLEPWLIYSHGYDDVDGILDLEIVPTHKANLPFSSSTHSSPNSTEFITWGPDFRSQEAIRSTGTFHIKGPILVKDSQYSITVTIVAKDNIIFSKPITDTFVLSPQSGIATSR